MTRMKRRHFLQLAGSTFAALGLHEAQFFRQSEEYGRVLAQPTGRKLALLVGVNQYPGTISDLRGCLTDVEMQRQLLIHRYGFNPKDIVTLGDDATLKPTRENILTTFEEHLIKQTKPGDVVVFHFSGHGSRVVDPRPLSIAEGGLNGTLIPSDGRGSNARRGSGVDDIMGKTLFLLSSEIQTDNFTMVLDSCHSGGGTRGNLVFRNVQPRPGEKEAEPSQRELSFQEERLVKLDWSPDELHRRREAGIARGMALGSARQSQFATDAVFNGFYAGAFSYLLTQYLWQLPSSEPLETSFTKLALITRDVAGQSGITQDPIREVQKPEYLRRPIYFIDSVRPSAEAVLDPLAPTGTQAADAQASFKAGDDIKFWLGGVSSRSLESFGQGSVFVAVDDEGKAIAEIEQTGRQGLMAEGKLTSAQQPLSSGTLLREKIRGVPADLSLKLGLDPSLGDLLPELERELAAVSRVQPVAVRSTDPSNEVDYVLGRLTAEASEQGQTRKIAVDAPTDSVGLLAPGLVPVPDSFGGSASESAQDAIFRLRPRLKTLLAGKILTSVVNSQSSDLAVDVQIKSVKGGGLVAAQRSRGQDSGESFVPIELTQLQNQVKAGDEIQVEVTNRESRNLYLGVLVISNSGELAVLHPLDFESPEAASLVAPGKTVAVPEKTGNFEEDFRFEVQGPAGFFELMVLASTEPLRDALRALRDVARSRGLSRGNPLAFAEGTRAPGESEDAPLEVMQAMLGDLTRAGVGVARGTRGISTSGLAGFSNVIEVVE